MILIWLSCLVWCMGEVGKGVNGTPNIGDAMYNAYMRKVNGDNS